MDKHEHCEVICNQSNFIVPARSTLYSLDPIGLETGMCEGFISWLTRLSSTYRTTKELFLRCLFRDENEKIINASSSNLNILNGSNDLSIKMVRMFERLTFRKDLTYLTAIPYSQAISTMYLLKKRRTWCPKCFECWRTNQQPLYEPLYWSYSVSKICIIHHNELEDSCHHCGKQMHNYSSKQKIGYCDYCNTWLGRENPNKTITDFDSKLFVVNNLCQLIAHAPRSKNSPIRLRSGALFRKITLDVTEGKKKTFAKLCNIDVIVLKGYISGEYLPPLQNFLNIAYSINKPLTVLLYENLENTKFSISSRLHTQFTTLKTKRSSKVLDQDIIDEINSRIELCKQSSVTLTISQLCKDFNISRPTFKKYFPEGIEKLKEFNRYLFLQDVANRNNDLVLEVQTITEHLYKSGTYPSFRKVVESCGEMSFNQVLRKAWKNKLIELGVIERVNQYQ